MSLMDDPFADLVKYDGACQICHGDMRKCDGKCGGMMELPIQTTVSVKQCSSCGQDHDIRFSYFHGGVILAGEVYDYVGFCPTTNEAVYMRYNDDDTTAVDAPAAESEADHDATQR